jgi:hypothetical protein
MDTRRNIEGKCRCGNQALVLQVTAVLLVENFERRIGVHVHCTACGNAARTSYTSPDKDQDPELLHGVQAEVLEEMGREEQWRMLPPYLPDEVVEKIIEVQSAQKSTTKKEQEAP